MENDNVIRFCNDDEFTDFCLSANPSVHYDNTLNSPYYDYDFTPEYLDAIDCGKEFLIEDCSSKIRKRGMVTRGIISKKVSNLI